MKAFTSGGGARQSADSPGYHVVAAAEQRREGNLIRWQADCCTPRVNNENAAAYSAFGA
jgi:hypothetical protein